MVMPFNMILIQYVIPCKLSCHFSKLTILYIHVHSLYSIIFMTNKSVMTFLYVNKYLSISLISKIKKYLVSNLANLYNFQSLDVVDRVSQTQFQVDENTSDYLDV